MKFWIFLFLILMPSASFAETKAAALLPQRNSIELVPSESAIAYDDLYLIVSFPNHQESRHIKFPRGFSIGQVIEYIYETKRGKICTDSQGILSINGYGTDLKKGKYWTITVNGNFLNVNSNTVIIDEDKIEIEYHQNNPAV